MAGKFTVKTIGYIRVSNDCRNDKELSFKMQKDAIEAFGRAHKQGIKLFCYDDGVPGTTPWQDRPGMRQLMDILKPGDLVVSYRRDRLARDAEVRMEITQEFQEKGVIYASAQGDSANDSGADGYMGRAVSDMFAELESKFISKRMRENVLQRREQGKVLGVPPIGYKLGAEGRLELDYRCIDSIRIICERRAKGDSFQKIARHLNDLGYTTTQGKPFRRNSCAFAYKAQKILDPIALVITPTRLVSNPVLDMDAKERAEYLLAE